MAFDLGPEKNNRDEVASSPGLPVGIHPTAEHAYVASNVLFRGRTSTVLRFRHSSPAKVRSSRIVWSVVEPRAGGLGKVRIERCNGSLKRPMFLRLQKANTRTIPSCPRTLCLCSISVWSP